MVTNRNTSDAGVNGRARNGQPKTAADPAEPTGAELGRAIRRVVLSTHRLAPSIVGQPKEKIEALLKQQEEAVVAQLEIMDRTINSWSEMGERIEKTLGPLGDPV